MDHPLPEILGSTTAKTTTDINCFSSRSRCIIAGSIAPVFKLPEGDFEVFRPTGATRCTD